MEPQEIPAATETAAPAVPTNGTANAQTLELQALKGKTMSELLRICQELEIQGASGLRKQWFEDRQDCQIPATVLRNR